MKTSTNNSQIFQAKRLLQLKSIRNGYPEVTTIYSLNKNDYKFAGDCIDICKNYGYPLKDSWVRIYPESNAKDAFKNFWEDFFYLESFGDKFLVAIKDNKYIAGVLHCIDRETNPTKEIAKLILLKNHRETQNGLLYTIAHLMHRKTEEPLMEYLKQWEHKKGRPYKSTKYVSKNKQPVGSIFAKNVNFPTGKELLMLNFDLVNMGESARMLPSGLAKLKKSIREQIPEVKFELRTTSKDEVDLYEMLE